MGTSRTSRIGSREAEQLLTADPAADAHPALSDLLAAAAAPARPGELSGLAAAVAAFEAAGQDPPPRVAVPLRRRVFARSAAVKVAAGVAVALFGGTAVAAETGNLPRGSQQRAHEMFSGLGVPPPPSVRPAPTTAAPTTRATPTRTPTSPPGSGRPSSAPGPTPGPTGAAAPGAHGQCRSYVARQQNPKKKPLPAETLRRLAAAAGGEQHIAEFCAALLADPSEQTAGPPPGTASPTPTQPGNGNGNGNGNGKGNGKGRPSKTPKPKKG